MTRQSSETIPLPFATAAVGLCLSYLFPAQLNAIFATLLSFGIGVLILYFAGRSDYLEKDSAERSMGVLDEKTGRNLRHD